MWGSDDSCYEFLQRLEIVLASSGIDRTEWPKVFPYVIRTTEVDHATWVLKNISEARPPTDWDQAKDRFTHHFERSTTRDQLLRDYAGIYQGEHEAKESVQAYAERFRTLARRVRVDLNDPLTLYKFRESLKAGARNSLIDHVNLVRRIQGPKDYDLTSFEQVEELIIENDRAWHDKQLAQRHSEPKQPKAKPAKKGKQSASSADDFETGPSSGAPVPVNTRDNRPRPFVKKYCTHHRTHGHDTSECKAIMAGKTPDKNPHRYLPLKPGTPVRTGKCYRCGKEGHHATDHEESPAAGQAPQGRSPSPHTRVVPTPRGHHRRAGLLREPLLSNRHLLPGRR